MNQIIENTFYLPVGDDFLIHSPLKGVTALVNRQGVVELIRQINLIQSEKGDTGSMMFQLANDIANSPSKPVLRRSGAIKPQFLGIIPTRACNGACNYCDFGANTSQGERMSCQLAVQVVDWYIHQMVELKRDIVEIQFFGGEPMMAQDVVEVAVHRARMISARNKLIPYFEISTNGQYAEKEARWLGAYFNKVVLSFDGFEEIQNAHRPLRYNRDSYKNVSNTAGIIGESNAELSIRCCISQLNIEKMKVITEWFSKNFRMSHLNFEILCSTELSVKKGLFPPNPIDFAIQFQTSREIAKRYGIDVVYASDISPQPQVSSCPVGKDAVIVSPEGRISNCYLLPEKWKEAGLDLDFGTVTPTGEIHLNQSRLETIRSLVEEKPRCENCFCKWSCSGGCHVGNTFPGCSDTYDDFCIQTRIISLFSLLRELELHKRIDQLQEQRDNLVKMASQRSDRLMDFSDEN
jgi:uncharacterized protein